MATESLSIPDHPTPRIATLLGIRVREDTLYSNRRGEEKRGIRKREEKSLDKLQEVLRRFLLPEEAVLYIARCQSPIGLLERFTAGWHAYLLSGAVLIVTNRRLLHLPVNRNGSWTGSTRAAYWADVEEAKIQGLLTYTFQLKYRDGEKEAYWNLRGEDAKKIKILISALLPASRGEASSTQSVVSLCPNCMSSLEPGLYQCRKCALNFKDESTLIRRALLIPGGGYFYTGHSGLGVLFSFSEVVLLFLILFSILSALGIVAPSSETGPTSRDDALVGVIAFAVILGFEKAISISHCRRLIREYIPTGQKNSDRSREAWVDRIPPVNRDGNPRRREEASRRRGGGGERAGG